MVGELTPQIRTFGRGPRGGQRRRAFAGEPASRRAVRSCVSCESTARRPDRIPPARLSTPSDARRVGRRVGVGADQPCCECPRPRGAAGDRTQPRPSGRRRSAPHCPSTETRMRAARQPPSTLRCAPKVRAANPPVSVMPPATSVAIITRTQGFHGTRIGTTSASPPRGHGPRLRRHAAVRARGSPMAWNGCRRPSCGHRLER